MTTANVRIYGYGDGFLNYALANGGEPSALAWVLAKWTRDGLTHVETVDETALTLILSLQKYFGWNDTIKLPAFHLGLIGGADYEYRIDVRTPLWAPDTGNTVRVYVFGKRRPDVSIREFITQYGCPCPCPECLKCCCPHGDCINRDDFGPCTCPD